MPEENFSIQPKKLTKHKVPAFKMEETRHSLIHDDDDDDDDEELQIRRRCETLILFFRNLYY
jgi:hypothetical protein